MKKMLLIALLILAMLCGCGAMLQIPARSGPAQSHSPGLSPISPQPALEQVTPNGLVLRLLELEGGQHPGENVILSPLSIQMALAMAANGADGTARAALETLLGMDPAALNSMLGPYLAREDGVLSMANSMWFQRELEPLVKQDFKDTLKAVYAAGEGAFDPYSQADADTINGWVKDKTRNKIDSILTHEDLTGDTLAILINALYFNGKWADPFDPAYDVRDGIFRSPAGDRMARFMAAWGKRDYFETDWGAGFAKEYEEGYEFIALLPREEGAVDLTGLDLDAFLASRTGEYVVDLKLPKFELEYAASLVETLKGLGLESLFEAGSLNAMLTDQALAGGASAGVSDVRHKTYMKMYEGGTEAAAVTAVMVECGAAAPEEEPQVRQVWLDRPFAFLIRDTQSGQVVFCGVINSLEK